ncbi:MAG: rod shape-determining protein RodA [Actinomycetota bacterium]
MSITEDRSQISLLRRARPLRPDLFLVIPYLVLTALGLLMIYSASAPRLEALGASPTRDLEEQAAFVLIGFAAFAIVSLIDVSVLRPWVPALYLISVVSLVLVLSDLGTAVKGAQRWIQLGPLRFQPSEITKLAVILALAALLAIAARPMKWDRVARAVALVAVPSALIFLQPDLGTMLTLGFTAAVMLFVAGASWRQMAALSVAGLVGTVGLFRVGAIKEYQITRLTAFLDPTTDILGAQYNQYQSQIAIGSGGLFGKGLFGGTQTNLRFVPEQSSDFIFTAVGEQLGFVGSLLILALFGVIIWRVLVAAANGKDRFAQLIATGVAALLAFHVFVNIGMTIRIMPVTGLPLPFMSAGGTFFLAMSVALGMAHSVWMRRPPLPGDRSISDV